MSAQALLQQATGLNLTSAAAERAVRARMAVRGIAAHDAYLAQLSGAELTALIELVVVPESWMFRDADAFTQAARAAARLAAAGRSVRILSIPCAAGEEPYSMAMALRDAGVPDAACSIDAVDLSAAAIERAREGVYTRNAFRGSELAFRDRYFSPDGANFRIHDSLRRQVRFQQGNLFTFDAARYDIVFCRNLLIYFDDATIEQAIARLDALLQDDGLLFAGYAEVPAFCRHGFASARLAGAFALRKHAPALAPP
ncbi:MAG: protein-glutamate O-methyltransferase CheR, partial [Pseudomonadota bacterium]